MKKVIVIITAIIIVSVSGFILFRIRSSLQQDQSAVNSQQDTTLEQAIPAAPAEKVVIDKQAPDAVFIDTNGEQRILSEFRGQRIMLWLLATWCPSCSAGAQALEENNNKMKDLTIIALETYGNAGYRGPSIEAFSQQYAPDMLSAPNWIFGNAPKETTNVYNPRNYPDIYFLIDENGILRDIDGAPAATINKIIQFANGLY